MKPHDILDDLQALFWVLLWAIVALFEHPSKLSGDMFVEQDTAIINGHLYYVGGKLKKQFFLDDKIGDFADSLESRSVGWLLGTMATHWKQYYRLKAELNRADIPSIQAALDIAGTCHAVDDPVLAEQAPIAQAFAMKYAQVCSPHFWSSVYKAAFDVNRWAPDKRRPFPLESTVKQNDRIAEAMAKELRVMEAQKSNASRKTMQSRWTRATPELVPADQQEQAQGKRSRDDTDCSDVDSEPSGPATTRYVESGDESGSEGPSIKDSQSSAPGYQASSSVSLTATSEVRTLEGSNEANVDTPPNMTKTPKSEPQGNLIVDQTKRRVPPTRRRGKKLRRL